MDDIIVEICDYEEDKVINGVLHYWMCGAWHEYDKKCLTTMLLAERQAFINSCNPGHEIH